jgi:hypothetical protein
MGSTPKNDNIINTIESSKPEICDDIQIRADIVRALSARLDESPELFKTPDMGNLLIQIVDNVLSCHANIHSSTSNPSEFLTIGQLEEILLISRERFNSLDFQMLLNRLNNIECEQELIVQKKTTTETSESS